MTSLIDVIFLLLLFFMLSSTFSKFAEIELSAAGQSQGQSADHPPLFLRLQPETLSLNGQALDFDGLVPALAAETLPDSRRAVLVAMGDDVSSQRLTDLLVLLRGVAGIAPTVLGGSPTVLGSAE